MSAVAASTQITALPATQTIAQKLAYRMIQVNASSQKILSLFAEDAIFYWDPDTKMDKKQFSVALKKGGIDNITAIGQWKDTFQASLVDSKEMIWKIDGLQYRLGHGMKEEGPGWYHMEQTIQLKFVEEEGKVKISEFHSIHYSKTKQPESLEITALPLSQSIIHKLACKSFEIPQRTASLIELYNMDAIVILYPNRRMGLEEFAKTMRQNNTLNVLQMGEWSNTYSPVENSEGQVKWIKQGQVQWVAEGYQRRLGEGANEDGEGWYRIRQLAQFFFSDDVVKVEITEQNVLDYSKFKVVESETIPAK